MSIEEKDQGSKGVSQGFEIGDVVRIIVGEYLGELGTVMWVSSTSRTVTLEIYDRVRQNYTITKSWGQVKCVRRAHKPKRPDSAIIQDIRNLLNELES